MGKPEDLQMLSDIFHVSGQCLGMMRRALIHHDDNSSAGLPGTIEQFLQENLHTPSGLPRLNMVDEQSASVAERAENGLLAIDVGRANARLPTSRHPGASQMRMQVEF